MVKPVDVRERDKLRYDYLRALYEMERREKIDVGMIITMNIEEAKRDLSITETQIERVTADLAKVGLIKDMGGLSFCLTESGREHIENLLHEEHRPWHEKLRDKLSSPALIGGIAGLVTSLVVNILSASDIPWWVKLLLHRR